MHVRTAPQARSCHGARGTQARGAHPGPALAHLS